MRLGRSSHWWVGMTFARIPFALATCMTSALVTVRGSGRNRRCRPLANPGSGRGTLHGVRNCDSLDPVPSPASGFHGITIDARTPFRHFQHRSACDELLHVFPQLFTGTVLPFILKLNWYLHERSATIRKPREIDINIYFTILKCQDHNPISQTDENLVALFFG